SVINSSVCCWDLALEGGNDGPVQYASLKQATDGTLSGSFRAPLAGSDRAPLPPDVLEQHGALPYTLDLQTSVEGDTHGAAAGTPLVGESSITVVANGASTALATLS